MTEPGVTIQTVIAWMSKMLEISRSGIVDQKIILYLGVSKSICLLRRDTFLNSFRFGPCLRNSRNTNYFFKLF